MFSILNLLTVNLSLLLCFLNYFFLELHFRSFPAYLYHLIKVCYLDWKRLLLGRNSTRRCSTLTGKLLSIVGSFEHFITSRNIRRNLSRVQLSFSYNWKSSCPEVTRTICFCSWVKMNISCIKIVIEARTCIFHAPSSKRRSSITGSTIMRTWPTCHYNCCLNMASRLIKLIVSGRCLWDPTIYPLCTRVRHMIGARPWQWSSWLAMKTHSLPACRNHFVTLIHLTHVILAPSSIICAASFGNANLPLPPISE